MKKTDIFLAKTDGLGKEKQIGLLKIPISSKESLISVNKSLISTKEEKEKATEKKINQPIISEGKSTSNRLKQNDKCIQCSVSVSNLESEYENVPNQKTTAEIALNPTTSSPVLEPIEVSEGNTEVESAWETTESDGLLESETISSEKFQTEEVSDSESGWCITSSSGPSPYTVTRASFTGPEDVDWTSSALDSSTSTSISSIRSSDVVAARSDSSMDIETTYDDDTPDTEEVMSKLISAEKRTITTSFASSEGLSELNSDVLSESDVNDSSSMLEDVDNSSRSDFPSTLSTKDSHGASDSEDICSESPDSRSSEDEASTGSGSSSSESSTSRCTSSGTSSCINGSDKSLYDTIHIYKMRGCSVSFFPGNLIKKRGKLPRRDEAKYIFHDKRFKLERSYFEISDLTKPLLLSPPVINLSNQSVVKNTIQFISAFDEPVMNNNVKAIGYIPVFHENANSQIPQQTLKTLTQRVVVVRVV